MKLKSTRPPAPPPLSLKLPPGISRISPSDVRVGLRLKYLGDEHPYVGSFLRMKHEQTGTYPLVAREEGSGTHGPWIDLPGNKSDDYTIVSVEVGRRSKTKSSTPGRKLEDLFIIKGSGYEKVDICLGANDVAAKFGMDMTAPALTDEEREKILDEHPDSALAARLRWEKEREEDAW